MVTSHRLRRQTAGEKTTREVVEKKIHLLLLIVLLMVSSSTAYWPSDPQTNLPVCNATTDQQFPKIASGDSGSVIIVWQDDRNGLYTDIYA
jgi:hypothetical protein